MKTQEERQQPRPGVWLVAAVEVPVLQGQEARRLPRRRLSSKHRAAAEEEVAA
jgi:hypothetical protein